MWFLNALEFDKKFKINTLKSIFKFFKFTKIQKYLVKTLKGKTLRHMVASSASSFTKIRGKDSIFLTTFLLAAHYFRPEPNSHDLLHRLHGIPPQGHHRKGIKLSIKQVKKVGLLFLRINERCRSLFHLIDQLPKQEKEPEGSLWITLQDQSVNWISKNYSGTPFLFLVEASL